MGPRDYELPWPDDIDLDDLDDDRPAPGGGRTVLAFVAGLAVLAWVSTIVPARLTELLLAATGVGLCALLVFAVVQATRGPRPDPDDPYDHI